MSGSRWTWLWVPAGTLVVLAATLVAFGLPVVDSLATVADGAFGNRFGVARTLVKATPLLLASLGILLAWRAGMFNIGGEGQFVVGGLAGAWLAKPFLDAQAAGPWLVPAILAASIVGGAMWASLAGWLYAKRGVDVVISTILLNFAAIQALGWAVERPLRQSSGGLPTTDALPSIAMLPRLDPQSDLHAGVGLAIVAAIVVHGVLYLTRFGFRLRLVGANAAAARSARIEPKRIQVLAMAASGALCGLAGGVEYVGSAGQLGSSFAQGWGFLAIPVALLAGLHPLGAPFAAFLFGALFAGTEHLGRFTAAGATIIYVVQGASVLAFVALKTTAHKRAALREAG